MELAAHPGEVTPIGSCMTELGEGPVWVESENALYWVDIASALIWRMHWPQGTPESWTAPFRVSALAPRSRGGFIAATDKGFAEIDPGRGVWRLIGSPEPDLPGNRFNDGKVDREGNFWAGTMDDAEVAVSGALYRLDPTLAWLRVDAGYKVPNGPAFSLDGHIVYHADSARRLVYRYDLGPGGKLGPRRIFLSFTTDEGFPDGMTVDAEDCLWIAFWDGWCLRRFSPEGDTIARLDVPVQRPTSCTFGGPAFDRLFITSARIGLTPDALSDQPLAGRLFAATPGCVGVRPTMFAG